MHTLRSYTLEEARLLALHGAGFATADAPANPPLAALELLGLLQIDTVNVFARAHTMPAFSRFGGYPVAQLDALMSSEEPKAIEYWAHEACVMPVDDYRLFGWRRAQYISETEADSTFWNQNQKLVDWILAEIENRGPLTVAELEHESNKTRGGWWGWSEVKRLAVIGFLRGDLVAWGRRGTTRVFDLASNHPKVAETPLSHLEQMRELLLKAAKVLGIAREEDLADYYRMRKGDVRPILRDLVAGGDLISAVVDETPVFLSAEFGKLSATEIKALGDRINSSPTLLSPFDPLVWFRPRVEWLWDFHYRIEIYTPAAKRQFGYYSLPILMGEMLAGRIDLKADRKRKQLVVQSAWHELETFGAKPTSAKLKKLANGLGQTLEQAARWQGCDSVKIEPKGNLSTQLAMLKGSTYFF